MSPRLSTHQQELSDRLDCPPQDAPAEVDAILREVALTGAERALEDEVAELAVVFDRALDTDPRWFLPQTSTWLGAVAQAADEDDQREAITKALESRAEAILAAVQAALGLVVKEDNADEEGDAEAPDAEETTP